MEGHLDLRRRDQDRHRSLDQKIDFAWLGRGPVRAAAERTSFWRSSGREERLRRSRAPPGIPEQRIDEQLRDEIPIVARRRVPWAGCGGTAAPFGAVDDVT